MLDQEWLKKNIDVYEADEMCGMCKVDSTTAYKIGILILYQNLMPEIVT